MFRDAKYLLTAVDPKLLAACKAEIAFLGRSNVGKSSLINAICQRKNLARSSQVPGKTRTINIYEISKDRWIADLPGYGYASGPKASRQEFGAMIEGYLASRKSLKMLFLIIDAVAGPTKLDMLMYEWLKFYSVPFSIVVNKTDKIRPSKLAARSREIANALDMDPGEMSFVSSLRSSGISALRKKAAGLLDP